MAHGISSLSRAPRGPLSPSWGPLISSPAVSYAYSGNASCSSEILAPRDSLLTTSTNDSVDDAGFFIGSMEEEGKKTAKAERAAPLPCPLRFHGSADYPSNEHGPELVRLHPQHERRAASPLETASYNLPPLLEKKKTGGGGAFLPQETIHQHDVLQSPSLESQNSEPQQQQQQQQQQQRGAIPIPLTGTILADRRIIFYRTQMCPHVARGQCRLGSKCRFAHRREELRPPPRLDKTRMCAFVKAGITCARGSACSFAHSRDELRHTTAFFKTNMCRNWLSGRCLHPETCNHAHGMQELLFFRTIATQSGVRDFVREKTTAKPLTAAEEESKKKEGNTQQEQEQQQQLWSAATGASQGSPQLSPAPTGVLSGGTESNGHNHTSQQEQQQQNYSLDALSGQLLECLMLHLQHHRAEKPPLANPTERSTQHQERGAPGASAAAALGASGLEHRRPRRNKARMRGPDQQHQQRKSDMECKEAAARMQTSFLELQHQQSGPMEAVAAALLQMLQGSGEKVAINPREKGIIPRGRLQQQHQQQQQLQQATAQLSGIRLEATEFNSTGNPNMQGALKALPKGPMQVRPEVGHWDVESTGSTETVSSTVQTFEEGSRGNSREWLAAENLAELLNCDDLNEQRQQQQQQQQQHQQQRIISNMDWMEAATPFELHRLLVDVERQQLHHSDHGASHQVSRQACTGECWGRKERAK